MSEKAPAGFAINTVLANAWAMKYVRSNIVKHAMSSYVGAYGGRKCPPHNVFTSKADAHKERLEKCTTSKLEINTSLFLESIKSMLDCSMTVMANADLTPSKYFIVKYEDLQVGSSTVCRRACMNSTHPALAALFNS